MSKQILISHSSKDNDSAQRVKKVLEDNGFSCWLDNDNIPAGADFVTKIAEAMRNCDVVVVLVSKNSQTSDWVRKEVTTASSQKKLIIPYMLQDFEINDEFSLCLGNAQRVSGYGDKEEDALRRVITAVHDYLQDVAEGEEIKITIEKNPARRKKQLMIALAAVGVLGIILAAILLPKGSGRSKFKDALEVYYSEVLPYEQSGYFQTAETQNGVVSDTLKAKKAFSILSFVRNNGGEAAFVEQISCDIDGLKVDESPVMTADAYIKDNIFKAFAYNDGWGDSKDTQYEITLEQYEDDVPLFGTIKNALEKSGTVSVKSGSVELFADVEIPTAEVKTFAEKEEIGFAFYIAKMQITVKDSGNERTFLFSVEYDPSGDRVFFFRGGKGDGPEYSITLFAYLNVDEKPTSVRFTGAEAAPLVDNTFRIETVLIPDKSCSMVCRGVYSIAGKTHVTDDFDVSVTVPIFKEAATYDISNLTMSLFDVDMRDTIAVTQLLEPYLYDPETIIQYSR